MIVALDPGFGNTKVSTAARCALIQTAIARPKNIGRAAMGLRTITSNAIHIRIKDGGEYIVGPGAWSYGEPLSTLDFLSITSEPRLSVFYAALAQCLEIPAGITEPIDTLVIGLPVPLLENVEEANSTIAALRELKREHVFSIAPYRAGAEEKTFKVRIANIKVLAQPVGAYADYVISDDLKIRSDAKSSEVAVVDLGMNTLDLYVVQSGRVSPRFIGGDKIGTRRLLELLDGGGLDLDELDAAVRENRIKIPEKALDAWLLPVIATIEKTWPKLDRFSAVILSGGGSMLLGTRLASALARRGAAIHLPESPVLTNVRGLYKWAAYSQK
jgi:hypothetical protein